MNTISTSYDLCMLDLEESDLQQIAGGMEPLSIVFGLAALTATLINMVNNNPDYYSSAAWYGGSPRDVSADLHYYDSLPVGV